MDLDDKKVLIWPDVANKFKGKGVLIGDPPVPNLNMMILSREVVVEKTPDGGETMKVTIKSSNIGGQTQTDSRDKPPVLRIVDGSASTGGWSCGDQRQWRLRTFKCR